MEKVNSLGFYTFANTASAHAHQTLGVQAELNFNQRGVVAFSLAFFLWLKQIISHVCVKELIGFHCTLAKDYVLQSLG